MGDGRTTQGKDESASKDVKPRCLTVLYSGDPTMRGRVIPLGDHLVIGRNASEGIDLAVDDKLLSRKHATIKRLGTSQIYEIVDHDSRNGSFVDGVRREKSHLKSGSILRLGVTVFELTCDDEGRQQAPAIGTDRDAFIGQSVAFRDAFDRLQRAAKGDEPVVFSGEAGTGKTMAAAYLHRESGRDGPLLVIGCGAAGPRLATVDLVGGEDPDDPTSHIDGYLASCENGTLLFDEIDLLDPDLQKALLEILRTGKYSELGEDEEKPVNVRILGSTAANLAAAVDAGAFDRDLYEVLAAHHIEMPSLRDRRSDIPLLAQHFLKLEEPNRKFDWSATFLEKLLLYDWPVNVRELRTIMRRLTMVEEDIRTLRSAHLPKEIRSLTRMPSEDQLRASAIQIHAVPSRGELEKMLVRFRGDVQRLAEHYAKDRRHVYKWLNRHDLSAGDFRKTD
jgi:DNA-binding NtrC family response regulator